MVCFNPKPAKEEWFRKINEKTGEIYKCKRLKFISWAEVDENFPYKDGCTMIPCGKCEGCQIDKANEWATRAVIEAQKWPKNAFLTLTYSNDNLPKKRTLVKADLQNFWKRLRKKEKNIRYIACGEYGPRTLRPHYHAGVFNYWPKDTKIYKKNLTNDILYTSEELNKIWGKGYVIIGQLTYESAAYIARYVYKKALGINKEWNKKHGRTPEFTLSSRRPGIAALGWENKEIWNKIMRSDGILVKTKDGVRVKKIPEYLKKKWREKGDREAYYKWSEARAREFKTLTRARDTSDNYFQQLKKNIEIIRKKLKILDKRQDV